MLTGGGAPEYRPLNPGKRGSATGAGTQAVGAERARVNRNDRALQEFDRQGPEPPGLARRVYARVVIVPYRDPLEHPAAPDRSPDQRSAALNRANEIRTLRAQLKRDIKAGRTSIATLLLDPPSWLQTAKVSDILLALPKVGRVKAMKTLDSCRVSPSKTFGGLTDRQRAELASRLNQ